MSPKKRIDIIGLRFGRLVVVEYLERRGSSSYYLCACDCGGRTETRVSRLRAGRTRSCGCLMKESLQSNYARGRFKHGITVGGTPRWYSTYLGMLDRCRNSSHEAFHNYGGRGIAICDRWLQDPKNFLTDMGEPPDGLTLDRIDNDGPYSPDNCRWADDIVQKNNKRNNRVLSFAGESRTLAEWARHVGLSQTALSARLFKGWPVERALTTPPVAKTDPKPPRRLTA